MTWKMKAAIQRILSAIPGGVHVNYALQRHVVHTLPESDTIFQARVRIAQQHLRKLAECGSGPLESRLFFEFGAGRDLCGPLVFHAMGIERQYLVDLEFLLRPFLVNDTIRRLQQASASFQLRRTPAHLVRETRTGCLEDLRRYYGIDFRAPADARRTELADGSVDVVTSTNTLEHIPPGDIALILKEMQRVVAADGWLSFLVDYQDHWSYFDKSINVYHFLRYTAEEWKPFNPSLNYQNRMRHPEYMRLYEQGGFVILDEQTEGGQPEDLEQLAVIPTIAPDFGRFSRQELSLRKGFVVMRKRG